VGNWADTAFVFTTLTKESLMNTRTAVYWAATGLLALAMFGSGLGALIKLESLVETMQHLGYPTYVGPILGLWYVSAAIALVVPGLPLVKEWAYAGLIFAMTGAFASHLFAGDGFADYAPSLVLTALVVTSYVLRPANRQLRATKA